MNNKNMNSYYQLLADTLADDIYDGWLLSAQNALDNDSHDRMDISELHKESLRKYAYEAAVTAIGFAAALCDEAVLKVKQTDKSHLP